MLHQSLLFGWYPGPMELMIIGGVCLLLFGNRVPSVMRSMGLGLKNFKEGMSGIEHDIEQPASKEVEVTK